MADKKRKRVFIRMEDKLKAIKRLDSGESGKKIANELGVGTSTISDWKKSRKEIENWCSSQASGSGINTRKTMKTGKHREVEEALFLWHEHLRGKGLPVTGPMLQEKALLFKQEIEGETTEFNASEGWLFRWKKRYGVRQLTISGEALSSDTHAVPAFKEKLQQILEKEEITGEQVYNCDETGLNYKMLPTKTLASRTERAAPGYKKSKERVTILACSNATGNHKLRLTLIGKSKKPRAFKKIKSTDDLPLFYTNQTKAWMNSKIFSDWFSNEFVPSVEKHLKENNLPRKALLLMDNAPSHPAAEELSDGDIKTLFLPPNTTAIVQPMDQGVLEMLKKKYRKRFLSRLISSIDSNEDYLTTLKTIDILDVIRWVAEAWEEVPSITLVKSWRNLLDHGQEQAEQREQPIEEPAETDNENQELVSLLQKVPLYDEVNIEDIAEWMGNDQEEELTDVDFIQMVAPEVEGTAEEEDEPEQEKTIPHSEALRMFEATLDYIQHQPEVTPADIICFRKWRDIASRRRAETTRQLSLKDFFKQ